MALSESESTQQLESSLQNRLAYLLDPSNVKVKQTSVEDLSSSLIEHCSNFFVVPRKQTHSSEFFTILLTGATGFLGSHLLLQLMKATSVKKIYCLIRADNNDEANLRLFGSYCKRNFSFQEGEIKKIECVVTLTNDVTEALKCAPRLIFIHVGITRHSSQSMRLKIYRLLGRLILLWAYQASSKVFSVSSFEINTYYYHSVMLK